MTVNSFTTSTTAIFTTSMSTTTVSTSTTSINTTTTKANSEAKCQEEKFPSSLRIFKTKKTQTSKACRDLCNKTHKCEYFNWKVIDNSFNEFSFFILKMHFRTITIRIIDGVTCWRWSGPITSFLNLEESSVLR